MINMTPEELQSLLITMGLAEAEQEDAAKDDYAAKAKAQRDLASAEKDRASAAYYRAKAEAEKAQKFAKNSGDFFLAALGIIAMLANLICAGILIALS